MAKIKEVDSRVVFDETPGDVTIGDEAQEIAEKLAQAETWSAKIRYLHSQGFKNSSIAYILSQLRGYPMSPQHVNNVLQRPLKSAAGAPRSGRPKRQTDHRAEQLVRILPKPVIISEEEEEEKEKERRKK